MGFGNRAVNRNEFCRFPEDVEALGSHLKIVSSRCTPEVNMQLVQTTGDWLKLIIARSDKSGNSGGHNEHELLIDGQSRRYYICK
jgi:hypothetical protein